LETRFGLLSSPAPDGKDNPAAHEFEEWEGKMIAEYLHRHDL
jgi:hypothetical protein